MSVQCAAIMLVEYPSISRDGKLSIGGVVDVIQYALKPGLPADTKPGAIVLGVPISLVAILHASIADGLEHRFGMTVRHEDGKDIISEANAGALLFTLNKRGRRLKANLIVELRGLTVPTPGDYEVILMVDGTEVGRTPLYVDSVEDS